MPRAPAHPAALDDAALLAQCQVRRGRASGPGGQHRNKVETAVHLHHQPTGLEAAASERRSQAQNQAMALRRLRLALAIEHRGGRPASPTDLWRSRVAGGRIAVNVNHRDYPALLAEAMDWIVALDHDMRRAGDVLDTSPSQLVKLLAKTPAALAALNRARAARGLHKLRGN